MSKTFYRPSALPRLFQRFFRVESLSSNKPSLAVEVWKTPCIVTRGVVAHIDGDDAAKRKEPGSATASPSRRKISGFRYFLVNPSNSQLSGVANFPYFPRGGPVPTTALHTMHKDWQPVGHVSQWGGMEVGNGMMYPITVVDGLVHLHGGRGLQWECQKLRWKHKLQSMGGSNDVICAEGDCMWTSHGGDDSSPLERLYPDGILHTVPPFYKEHSPEEARRLLQECYHSVLDWVSADMKKRSDGSAYHLAVPLIGAGARGFPVDDAIYSAVQACRTWKNTIPTSDDISNEAVSPMDVSTVRFRHCRNHEDKDKIDEPVVTISFGLLEENDVMQLVQLFEA